MNILDRRFRYVNSYSTDLRKSFARIRRELRAANAAVSATDMKPNVLALERQRKTAQ
jgi:hypothetical protein